MTSALKYLWYIALCTFALGCAPQSDVRIDISGVIAAALDSGLPVDRITLKISGDDFDDIEAEVEVESGEFELEVPSGLARLFELTAFQEENAVYWGLTLSDLERGAVTDLELPITAAGVGRFSFRVPEGTALPQSVQLQLNKVEAVQDFASTFNVTLSQTDVVDVILPIGAYRIEASAENLSLFSSADFDILQGETLAVDALFVDADFCDTNATPLADNDNDGVDCTLDSDDTNANCGGSPIDTDNDGFCIDFDCDDTQETGASCSNNCSFYFEDKDGDGAHSSIQVSACAQPPGFVDAALAQDDVDDENPNCDISDVDLDNDGFCENRDCDESSEFAALCAESCLSVRQDQDGDGFFLDSSIPEAQCGDGEGVAAPGFVNVVGAASDVNDSNEFCTTELGDVDGDGFCTNLDCDDAPVTGAACGVGCLMYASDLDGDDFYNAATVEVRCPNSIPSFIDISGKIPDLDDTRSSCTTDLSDSDADGTIECLEACIDMDGDDFGLLATAPFGAGSVLPQDCLDDNGEECGDINYCLQTDVNDAASSCTDVASAASDSDGDGIPDCEDGCIDVDQDGFGLNNDSAISPGTTAPTGCTTDGSSACANANGCIASDVNDGLSSCTNDNSSDADGDGTVDCQDGCFDRDQDAFGQDQGPVGSATVTPADCTIDGSMSCGFQTCLGTDINDFATSCTDDNTDSDGDGILDCLDACDDNDHDNYGTDQDLRVSGTNAATVSGCLNDFGSACSLGDTVCLGLDCDDNASSCTDVCAGDGDGDGTLDCLDPCFDLDGDEHGTIQNPVGVNAAPPADCLSDGSTACANLAPACLNPDVDDTASSCTDDDRDDDFDGLADCRDGCIDRDQDNHGIDHTGATIGFNAAAVSSCLDDTGSACAIFDPFCPGAPDCNDGDPRQNNVDMDNDGVSTCAATPDCDDLDPNNFPGRTSLDEISDGRDNTCGEFPEIDGDSDGLIDFFDPCPSDAPSFESPSLIRFRVQFARDGTPACPADGVLNSNMTFIYDNHGGTRLESISVVNENSGNCDCSQSGVSTAPTYLINASDRSAIAAAWGDQGQDFFELEVDGTFPTSDLYWVELEIEYTGGRPSENICMYGPCGSVLNTCFEPGICDLGPNNCPNLGVGTLNPASRDQDGDGFGDACDHPTGGSGSTSSNDPSTYPGARERCGDGTDNDGVGGDATNCAADFDTDGYLATVGNGDDCNQDVSTYVFNGAFSNGEAASPGHTKENHGPCGETGTCCSDGLDNDCDGLFDENDSACTNSGTACLSPKNYGAIKALGFGSPAELYVDFCQDGSRDFGPFAALGSLCSEAAAGDARVHWVEFAVENPIQASHLQVCIKEAPRFSTSGAVHIIADNPSGSPYCAGDLECLTDSGSIFHDPFINPTSCRIFPLMPAQTSLRLGFIANDTPNCVEFDPSFESATLHAEVALVGEALCADYDQDGIGDCADQCVDRDGDFEDAGGFTVGCDPDSFAVPDAEHDCNVNDPSLVQLVDIGLEENFEDIPGTSSGSNWTATSSPFGNTWSTNSSVVGEDGWDLFRNPEGFPPHQFDGDALGTNGSLGPNALENSHVTWSGITINPTPGDIILEYDIYTDNIGTCGQDDESLLLNVDGGGFSPIANCSIEAGFDSPYSVDHIRNSRRVRHNLSESSTLGSGSSAEFDLRWEFNTGVSASGEDGMYIDNIKVLRCEDFGGA